MKRFSCVIIVFCLVSCNGSIPTEQMAFRKLLSKQTEREKALFELVDFKQTSGNEVNFFGETVYQISYHVKKVAKVNLHEAHGIGTSYFVTDSAMAQDSATFAKMKGGSHVEKPSYERAFKKGELVKEMDGKLRFVKRGNGWQ